MTHIYQVKNISAERIARRMATVAEIRILRKFEGKKLIDDRIATDMTKLHSLWFGPEYKKERDAGQ